LDLDSDQVLFGQTCRQFLEKEFPLSAVRELLEQPAVIDRELSRREAELGWFGLLSPEDLGGGGVAGLGVADSATVAAELGRNLHPGPALMTNLVSQAIAAAGSAGQRKELVPNLIGGEASATWAIGNIGWLWGRATSPAQLSSGPDGMGVLSGSIECVQDATTADHLLVTVPRVETGAPAQIVLPRDTPGLEVIALHSLDLTRSFANVVFRDIAIPADQILAGDSAATDQVQHQLDLAVILQTAESVGAIDRVYEFTLQYARDRIAFGRPIGSYQAIKHRLADLLVWLESSKATLSAAIDALEASSDDSSHLVSLAAAYVGDIAPRLVQECVQLHGGIGLTWEHDIHLYLRRVATNAALLGSPAVHRQRLEAILMPAS
jgi:alkylation response protein AidB-like acyl-CoA dehydrogenase